MEISNQVEFSVGLYRDNYTGYLQTLLKLFILINYPCFQSIPYHTYIDNGNKVVSYGRKNEWKF